MSQARDSALGLVGFDEDSHGVAPQAGQRRAGAAKRPTGVPETTRNGEAGAWTLVSAEILRRAQ